MRKAVGNLPAFAWVAAAALVSAPASAKNLQGRLGLGFNNELANSTALVSVPGISLKYGLTRDVATELIFGTATTSPANLGAALKLFKNIFYETDLNFYATIGGGILAVSGFTGAEFLAGFGVEFFIPGVESLGLSVETGAELDNATGSFVVRTLGVSFLNAGIHFYF